MLNENLNNQNFNNENNYQNYYLPQPQNYNNKNLIYNKENFNMLPK